MLGLPEEATVEQVTERFRGLALSLHPDRGGSAEEMLRLIEARDTVLAVKKATALVPLSQVGSIVSQAVATTLAQQRQQDAADRDVRRILRLLISPVRRERNAAAMVGVLSAALALLSTKAQPLFGERWKGLLTITLGALTAFLGLVFMLLDAQAKRLEEMLADLGDSLADREFYFEFLRQAIGPENLSPGFTRSALSQAIEQWLDQHPPLPKVRPPGDRTGLFFRLIGREDPLHVVCRRLGTAEVARLVISKGLERGFLIEEAADSASGPSTRFRAHTSL